MNKEQERGILEEREDKRELKSRAIREYMEYAMENLLAMDPDMRFQKY